MLTPSSASSTAISEIVFSLSAKALVKPAGICWTITTPQGRFPGSLVITFCKGWGPPVEVPMTTSFSAPLPISVIGRAEGLLGGAGGFALRFKRGLLRFAKVWAGAAGSGGLALSCGL